MIINLIVVINNSDAENGSDFLQYSKNKKNKLRW